MIIDLEPATGFTEEYPLINVNFSASSSHVMILRD